MGPLIKENVSLKEYTTFKIGGNARYFSEVHNIEELNAAVNFAKQNLLPHFVLGGGSNVLVGDGVFPGLVLKMNVTTCSFVDSPEEEVMVTAGAGVVLDDLIEKCVLKNVWGLENLSHIPGSVGATPVQNVGAYGVEVCDVISVVHTYDVTSHVEKDFKKNECAFSYRDSFFKTSEGKNYIVTGVTFTLKKNRTPKIVYADLANFFSTKKTEEISLSEIRAAVIAVRAQKFPDWTIVGTAGSFFKNPIVLKEDGEKLLAKFPALPVYELDSTRVKCSLGYILDKVCGLKGYREGKVRLYEKQALVVVAERGATAQDIMRFTSVVAEKVFEKTGIKIEPEVQFV